MGKLIPKSQHVWVPYFQIPDFGLANNADLPEVREICKASDVAWKEAALCKLMQDNRGEMQVHRHGDIVVEGDQGLVRLAIWARCFLHSKFRQHTIMSYISDIRDYFGMTEGYDINALQRVSQVAPNQPLLRAICFFYAFNVYELRRVDHNTLDTLRQNIALLARHEYLQGDSTENMITNVIIFHMSMTYQLLVQDRELDENGMDVNPVLTMNYVAFDLSAIYLNSDYHDLLHAYRTFTRMRVYILGVLSLNDTPHEVKITADSRYTEQRFFETWSTNLLKLIQDLSNISVEDENLIAGFLIDAPILMNIKRIYNSPVVAEDKRELYSIDGVVPNEFNVFDHVGTQDITPEHVRVLVSEFKSRYTNITQTFCEMIRDLFVELPDNIKDPISVLFPSTTFYSVRRAGNEVIYGGSMSSPYSRIGWLYYQTRFGRIYSHEFGSDKHNTLQIAARSQAIGIQEKDIEQGTFRGILSLPVEQYAPYLMDIVRRELRSFVVSRETSSTYIYTSRYENQCYLMIQPRDVACEVFFNYERFGIQTIQHSLAAILQPIDIAAVGYHNLLFVVSEEMVVHNNMKIDQDQIVPFLISRYKSITSNKAWLCDINKLFIRQVLFSVPDIAAKMGKFSNYVAESIPRMLSIATVDDALPQRDQGGTVEIPRTLYVPFMIQRTKIYHADYNTLRQRGPDNPFHWNANTEEVIGGVNWFANFSQAYSDFHHFHSLGVAVLRFRREFLTNKKLKVHHVQNDLVSYDIRSLINNDLSREITRIGMYGAFNEMDFYDPFKLENWVGCILKLFAAILTDFQLVNTVRSFSQTPARVDHAFSDPTVSVRTLVDIYNFLTDLVDGDDFLTYYKELPVAITFGQIIDALEESYTIGGRLLESDDIVNEATDLTLFHNSFIRALHDLQRGNPIFWSNFGYEMVPLYFGNVYNLLVDKLVGSVRYSLAKPDLINQVSVGLNSMPHEVISDITVDIKENLNIILFNALGKFLYGGVQ